MFRSGLYLRYLEPGSTAGAVEYHLYWLKQAPKAHVPEVLVMGDSRVAEGFSSAVANTEAAGKLYFYNVGVPGSSPRVWYYMLRDADPDRNRFSTIVIPFDEYSDQDWGEDPANREADVNFVAGRLDIDDCFDFADSIPDRSKRAGVLTQCFLKGTAFRADAQAFLSDIPDRIARARDWRERGAGYQDGYEGKPEVLTGLTVDLVKREIDFPPNLKDWQMDTVRTTCLPKMVEQTGALTRYRREWLGSILAMYKGSSTRFVFLQIPRAPWPIPNAQGPARFVESAARNPLVTVLPRNTFKDLEHPEIFADGLHMNHEGRVIFSKRLADLMVARQAIR